MQVVNSTDIQRRFGQHLEASLIEPVLIEKNGRAVAALVSIKYLELLQALEDKYWADEAIEAQKTGYVTQDKAMEALKLR